MSNYLTHSSDTILQTSTSALTKLKQVFLHFNIFLYPSTNPNFVTGYISLISLLNAMFGLQEIQQ
jgi:hypothetical protein